MTTCGLPRSSGVEEPPPPFPFSRALGIDGALAVGSGRRCPAPGSRACRGCPGRTLPLGGRRTTPSRLKTLTPSIVGAIFQTSGATIRTPGILAQLRGQVGRQVAEDGAGDVLAEDHHPLDLAEGVADQVPQAPREAEQAHHAEDRDREADQGQRRPQGTGQQVPPGEGPMRPIRLLGARPSPSRTRGGPRRTSRRSGFEDCTSIQSRRSKGIGSAGRRVRRVDPARRGPGSALRRCRALVGTAARRGRVSSLPHGGGIGFVDSGAGGGPVPAGRLARRLRAGHLHRARRRGPATTA